MLFSDARIKEIEYVVRYQSAKPRWTATDRKNHIIGIKLSGSADHIFADRRARMEENCIFFLNQRDDYRVENNEAGISFSVHFTTAEPIQAPSFCIKVQERGNLMQRLESIEQQFKKSGGSTLRSLSDLYRLLEQFEEIYAKKYHPQNPDLLAARQYLLAHFKEKGCIDAAAEQYGVTRRRFNDLFKETFDITPNRLIIHHKLELAKKLLGTRELSLAEISAVSGFADVYYFSKLFKKETGLSPTEYRKEKTLSE